VPNKVDLWELSDLATPWSVRVVATLRIPEHMSAGVTKVEELAAAARCDRQSLTRVLRHLVGKGLFEEPVTGEFTMNDAGWSASSRGATRELPDSGLLNPGLDLDGYGGRLAGVWTSLLTAVRTGRPAYDEVFGRPFWDDLDKHREIAESFDTLMGPQGHGVPDPEILVNGDWETVRQVADIGGGTGAMLAEILRAHPDVRGILVDLPRTVTASGEIFAAAGVTDRVSICGQSFFDALPTGADVYLLTSLLFDWPDQEAITLLTRCGEAAGPGGRVVVVGGVAPETASGEADLLMMVLLGGKVRSLAEFRELAAKAALQVSSSGPQRSGVFLVECRPV
jgi:hypothetical protein